MKKQFKILLFRVAAAAIVWRIYIWGFVDRQPLSEIQRRDISHAKVTLIPPDETVTVEDKEKLAQLLQSLKVKRRSTGFEIQFYSGQAVTVTINLSDGKTVQAVSVGNMWLVIDGRYYKADYHSSENLNNWANSLLK